MEVLEDKINLCDFKSFSGFKKIFLKKNKSKTKRNKIEIILLIITFVFILSVPLFFLSKHFMKFFRNFKFISKKKNWKEEKIVIHSLGEFNNAVHTNSYESLNYYYIVKKMKLMEADFQLTNDSHIVTSHDFEILNGRIPSLEEFKKTKTKGNLTPMTFKDLIKYMYNHEDLYIITDTKYADLPHIEIEFNEMTEILSKYGNVNERFIIEIYNEAMYEFIKSKKYPFNNFLFTLYLRIANIYDMDEIEKVFNYTNKKGIEGIIMPYEWFRKEILELSKKYNVPIYIYSIANIEKAVELFNLGIKAIYSYNLTYDILEEHLKKKNYRLLSYS